MSCSFSHTDSEVETLVQKLIDEDNGRQNAILDLALQFETSCTTKDDLRKAYEKCNDISQESRALIDSFLKEGSYKDYELNLSMYGKATKLEKHKDAKLAWVLEKYYYRSQESVGGGGGSGGVEERVGESDYGDRVDRVAGIIFGFGRKSPPEKFSGGSVVAGGGAVAG
ncbi:hypothetical protein Tco_1363048 [Tanacetum coccineum]